MTIISYYFQNNNKGKEVLHIVVDGSDMTYGDFSNRTWNCIMEENQETGKSINPDDVALEYAKVISQTKHCAIPFGQLGIKIIKEITAITTRHLEFVLKMWENIIKKGYNSNIPKNGSYAVAVDADTMEIQCIKCGGKGDTKLKKCGKCKLAHYCSTDCQKQHWAEHKLVCCTDKII